MCVVRMLERERSQAMPELDPRDDPETLKRHIKVLERHLKETKTSRDGLWRILYDLCAALRESGHQHTARAAMGLAKEHRPSYAVPPATVTVVKED